MTTIALEANLAEESNPPHRKPHIDREDIMSAALKLLGPNRSVSTISLREVARAAGIAPNSFYRHFRDMDELAVALIERAGEKLRYVIREARQRATTAPSIIRSSIDTFMEQLGAEEQLLHVLLCEGTVGSDAYKQAVEMVLTEFENELQEDLVRLSTEANAPLHRPDLVAKAITRLVFAMGGNALDKSLEEKRAIAEQMMVMVLFLMEGSEAVFKQHGSGDIV